MYCLWNGEYGEHDLNYISGLADILERQKIAYEKYSGVTVGDFTCLKVEYDWGKRDQRWTCKCNLCGKIIYQYHAYDWRRGKGKERFCDCRRERAIAEKQKKKEERDKIIQEQKKKYEGKMFGNWKVIRYNCGLHCDIECAVCGKIRKSVRTEYLDAGSYAQCNHAGTNDYSDPKWQGIKIGHLTSVRQEGRMYITKCDCGRERVVSPSSFFVGKVYRDCGYDDCTFANDDTLRTRKNIKPGKTFENDINDLLKRSGYSAEKTSGSVDFGVDIICVNENGEKIAVQCKGKKIKAGVSAIQEVYAGGRYYGIDKFAVVSKAGFTEQAIHMSRVLGVYLSDGDFFKYPNDIEKYAQELLPVYRINEGSKHYYELYGIKKTLADWCAEYGSDITTVREAIKNGMSLEYALTYEKVGKRKKYSIDGFTGSMEEIGKIYGILPATIHYRMKYRGMTLEEAVHTPLDSNGRKRKEK